MLPGGSRSPAVVPCTVVARSEPFRLRQGSLPASGREVHHSQFILSLTLSSLPLKPGIRPSNQTIPTARPHNKGDASARGYHFRRAGFELTIIQMPAPASRHSRHTGLGAVQPLSHGRDSDGSITVTFSTSSLAPLPSTASLPLSLSPSLPLSLSVPPLPLQLPLPQRWRIRRARRQASPWGWGCEFLAPRAVPPVVRSGRVTWLGLRTTRTTWP